MAHVRCERSVTLATGEVCTFNASSSFRETNIFWIWIVDVCAYDCEDGFMTVKRKRLFGFLWSEDPSRPLA